MPRVLDNIITEAMPDPRTHSVTLVWANGATTVSRFDHLVGRGVFAPLADPAVFAQVHVGERGRSLEWPGEIDFCADALWFEAHPEDAPQQSSVKHVTEVAAELARRGVAPDQRVTITIEPDEPDDWIAKARRFARPKVIAEGWSDEDIDRIIDEERQAVHPRLG